MGVKTKSIEKESRGACGDDGRKGRERPSYEGIQVDEVTERFPILYVPGYGSPPLYGMYVQSRLAVEGFEVQGIRLPYLQTADVVKSAEALAKEVQKSLDRFGTRKVNIVGHSIGGVITRYYLQKLDGWRYVHKAVFLSTPHKGVAWAKIGAFTKAGRQMQLNSEFLNELNSDPARCRSIKCLSIISNFDEVIVPKESGILDCGYNKVVNWPPFHWGLCLSNRVVGWIVDFFDGLYDIREGFAKPGDERICDESCAV